MTVRDGPARGPTSGRDGAIGPDPRLRSSIGPAGGPVDGGAGRSALFGSPVRPLVRLADRGSQEGADRGAVVRLADQRAGGTAQSGRIRDFFRPLVRLADQ